MISWPALFMGKWLCESVGTRSAAFPNLPRWMFLDNAPLVGRGFCSECHGARSRSLRCHRSGRAVAGADLPAGNTEKCCFPTLEAASFVRFSLPAWRALHLGRACRQCAAQFFKLLYRRSATGAVHGKPRGDHQLPPCPPVEYRRYSRIESCAAPRGLGVLAQPFRSFPAAPGYEMCGLTEITSGSCNALLQQMPW